MQEDLFAAEAPSTGSIALPAIARRAISLAARSITPASISIIGRQPPGLHPTPGNH